MLFDKSKSPSIANGLLATLTSLPKIADELKEDPGSVIKKLKTLREYLLDPAVMRISVAGDILAMTHPRSAFSDNFLPFNVSTIRPELRVLWLMKGLCPVSIAYKPSSAEIS